MKQTENKIGVLLYCLVGRVVASETVELEALGSVTGPDKVLLGFSIRNFSVAVTKSGFVPG